MELRDYYKVLNVRYGANKDEIKNAYRRLAKLYHPDINPTIEAQKKFVEINRAYEFLTKVPQSQILRESQRYRKSDEPERRRNQHDEEFHKRARERARVKREKMRQQQEEFKKSGIYDILLLLQYVLHYILVGATALLIFFPFYISITRHSFAFVYLFFFWLTGGFLAYYIIANRQKFFKIGKFYYNFPQIKQIIFNHHYTASTNCYYCRNHKANAMPTKLHLLKVRDVVLNNKGPLQHHFGYKRKNISVEIPRSKKALIIHFISSLIRITSIIAAIIFININAVLWRFILGLFIGTLLSFLIQFALNTKMKNSYIFTYGFVAKIAFWLLVISFTSSFDFEHLNIYGSEFTGVILVLLFLVDPLIESLIKMIFKNNYLKPLIKQPQKVEELLKNNFQYYLEISGWSMIYPISKWIFG